MDQPTTLLGSPAVTSAPISLCVPDDAVSLAVYGDSGKDVLESSYVASGLGEIVDPTSINGFLRVETPELMLPKSADVPLVPGQHQMTLAGDPPAWQPAPVVVIRRGARTDASRLALNLIFVSGCGIDSSNAQAAGDAASVLESIYASAGVTITAVGGGTIDDSSLAVIAASDEAKLVEAPVTPSATQPPVTGAVNLYFVRELLSNDTAGTLLGRATGIPGTPAIPRKAGIAVAVDAHRIGGAIDFHAMWITVAHEMGHWHGLRHTSERSGTLHDLVRDTPECPASRDFDHNGLVYPSECAGLGAENLMFWYYDLQNPPTQLTAGQAFTLSSALYIQPS